MSATTIYPGCVFKDAMCKICGVALKVQFDASAEAHWEAKLMPMASCDRCYDELDAFKRAEEMMVKLCGAVRNRKLISKKGVLDEEDDGMFRDAIEKTMRAYAYSVMALYRANVLFYSPDYVNLFMENPDKSYPMLVAYRKEAANSYQTTAPYFEFMKKRRELRNKKKELSSPSAPSI